MTLSDLHPYSFKVTLQFEGEYLVNSTCYGWQHDVARVSQRITEVSCFLTMMTFHALVFGAMQSVIDQVITAIKHGSASVQPNDCVGPRTTGQRRAMAASAPFIYDELSQSWLSPSSSGTDATNITQ